MHIENLPTAMETYQIFVERKGVHVVVQHDICWNIVPVKHTLAQGVRAALSGQGTHLKAESSLATSTKSYCMECWRWYSWMSLSAPSA
jgi:hypothetical protein